MTVPATEKEKHSTTPDITAFTKNFHKGLRSSQHHYVVLLGFANFNARRLVKQVEDGFSFRALEHLQRNMALPTRELAELVMIRPRTLLRRKEEGRLQPDESDRVLRSARLFGKTLELFNADVEAAREWLSRPQRAFNGETPLNVAKTEIGAREVENLIGRLEHGVLS